ncbi:hypothetical protein LEP1GSC199_2361 [Leptospira vanthielii serovar Holland str. Waz Holland = ATCC 700522]|jgi:hypothetical protein|nr:hypothetical protein LEP1GSC199_0712 [Leptospira vanthielii serovar Holland str. Waz Holland = ATCC 700522]EMY69118.1 hypothetical protein LEP1GSC199_3470 [Leptospira vanthielii serovar Holland str. Waz Holland = ATCC 700522]EMY70490.1 hypothetical protein LEP1GSC199_1609 [Leptospira vanthielii serovar Holland str. Waz Holland = ATCC 700522]EMY71673.1 hypothetical protein LEP1GSC199_0584 [Leptospira vanthielii serovar Holland str. Waz Holland = ATCC 700522]EMY71945.1 hypothetical protein LEP
MDVFYGRKEKILAERKEKLLEAKLKRKEYSVKANIRLVA